MVNTGGGGWGRVGEGGEGLGAELDTSVRFIFHKQVQVELVNQRLLILNYSKTPIHRKPRYTAAISFPPNRA